ncbi:colicin immunity domain-containing protein [Anaerolineales bacterium HSG24]|nr:colicin immunity domain-containing protein [Anaerolineales bacterium HSG24]
MMTLNDYESMLRAFLDKTLSVEEFETKYLVAVKKETGKMNPQLYDILQELFWAVDSYWPDCSPDEETPFIISLDTLRQAVEKTLLQLDQFYLEYQSLKTEIISDLDMLPVDKLKLLVNFTDLLRTESIPQGQLERVSAIMKEYQPPASPPA